MAENINNEDNFTGFKYLMDAKTSRQYAIEFVLDKEGYSQPKRPLYAFNADTGKQETLKPGETIYAFDDEYLSAENGLVTGEAYKITTSVDEKGQMTYDMPIATVSYRRFKDHDLAGQQRIKYDMIPESKQALVDPDFDGTDLAGFPTNFEAPGSVEFFPPHQKGGQASIARQAVKDLIATGKIVPATPRLTDDFNKTATPLRPVVVKKPEQRKVFTTPEIKIEQALAAFGLDLTAEARNNRLDPVVGRDDEIDDALDIIGRRKQASLCFTGEAGVGKSAMFAGIAQRIVNDEENLPADLKGARVIQLDLQAMNAGSMYRGQFEEKLKPLIEGLKERDGILKGRKIILAIDEIHSQLTAGKAEGGSDAGNMMKPFLASKGISALGTTTDAEYVKYIEKDPALASRFEKLRLGPPNDEATLTILKKLAPLILEHHRLWEDPSEEGQKAFEDELRYLVTMTNRYAPQESQPRKAEKALDMAASRAKRHHRKLFNREDTIYAVARMSHLTPEFLSQDDAQRFIDLKTELPKEVMGQPGISRIPQGLIGAHSGLANPKQPQGCFVLMGPTGTGKTETCKGLARQLFGDEKAIIRLDMSEYSEKHTVSRLIGAPPGYVGFDDAEPALTERVRQRPYSILLLDEIEKAHPDVFNVLLPILEDGKMTDSKGKTVLFNNVIIVMTTNLGALKVQNLLDKKGSSVSFGTTAARSPEELQKEMEKIYAEAVKQANGGPFRPEMINRIKALGGFIPFRPLDEKVIAMIASREIDQINQRLGAADGTDLPGATLEISEAAMKQICKEGYNPAMGARPLQTVVREKVINPFAEWIMLHKAEVRDFVAKQGPAKLVITSLDVDKAGDPTVTPKLVKAAAPAVVNDNDPAAAAAKKTRAPARKKAGAKPAQP